MSPTPSAVAQNGAACPERFADGPELLTVGDVCAVLRISPSTFYYWRQTRKAPTCTRLPNGALRVSREALNAWLTRMETR